jgi:hypothetical protein
MIFEAIPTRLVAGGVPGSVQIPGGLLRARGPCCRILGKRRDQLFESPVGDYPRGRDNKGAFIEQRAEGFKYECLVLFRRDNDPVDLYEKSSGGVAILPRRARNV